MGTLESKVKTEKEIENCVKIVPCTPPQGIKFEDISDLDPRSPSDNIIRTPLEFSKIGGKESPDGNEAITYAVDPRSPTDQFTRTPIIIPDKIHGPSKLHNKILDNARQCLLHTPTSIKFQNMDQGRGIVTSPKLLGSSTLIKRSCKRKSLVGLLETNIDYRETDLDNFVKINALDTNLTININDNDLPSGDIVECESCDPRSPSSDFLRTPIQIARKVGEIDLNNTIIEPNEEINTSETESLLKIVRDSDNIIRDNDLEELCPHTNITEENTVCSELLNKIEHQIEDLNIDQSSTDESIRDASIHIHVTDIVNNLIANVETMVQAVNEKDLVLQPETFEEHEIIDLTADVQEFDRKLTKLILDNNEPFSFKTDANTDQSEVRNRTPMKDRNAISEPKKPKLKVSDKSRKSEYAVSKIPVFRDKNGGKLKVQCENTPPNSMEIKQKKKTNKAKWDTDRTLVI